MIGMDWMIVFSALSFIVKLPVRRLVWMQTQLMANKFTHLSLVRLLFVLNKFDAEIPNRLRQVAFVKKLNAYDG